MDEIRPGARFGAWSFIAGLGATQHATRWLVLDERHHTNHLVYVMPTMPNVADQRRFIARAADLARCTHAHLASIQAYSFTPTSQPFVVTPYPGSHEGITTLREHINDKAGRLSIAEAERAIEHLISAISHAHATLPDHLIHGRFDAEHILIDRTGSLHIENYAFRSMLPLHTLEDVSFDRSDEVLSIVRIAYELLTGRDPQQAPMIPVSKLCPRVSRSTERWLSVGLDPALGYDTIEECATAYRDGPADTEPVVRTGRPLRSAAITARSLAVGGLWNRRGVRQGNGFTRRD